MKTSTLTAKQNIPAMIRNKAKTSLLNNLQKQLGNFYQRFTSLPSFVQLEITGIASLAFAKMTYAKNLDEPSYFIFTDRENVTNYVLQLRLLRYSNPNHLLTVLTNFSAQCNASIATQVILPPEGYTDIYSDCFMPISMEDDIETIKLLRSTFNNSVKIFEDCLESLLFDQCYHANAVHDMLTMFGLTILVFCFLLCLARGEHRDGHRMYNDPRFSPPNYNRFIRNMDDDYDEAIEAEDKLEPLMPELALHNDRQEGDAYRQREGYPNTRPLLWLSVKTAFSPQEGKPSSRQIVNSPQTQLFLTPGANPLSAPASANPVTPLTGDSEYGGRSIMRKASGH